MGGKWVKVMADSWVTDRLGNDGEARGASSALRQEGVTGGRL